MSNFDELLANNARFAATDAKDRVSEIPFLPNKQIYIITCIDPRVDPAAPTSCGWHIVHISDSSVISGSTIGAS
jgi:carbonic anhydrase